VNKIPSEKSANFVPHKISECVTMYLVIFGGVTMLSSQVFNYLALAVRPKLLNRI